MSQVKSVIGSRHLTQVISGVDLRLFTLQRRNRPYGLQGEMIQEGDLS